jgi:hypothetical protein
MAGSSPAMTILWELNLPQVCSTLKQNGRDEPGHLHFVGRSAQRYGAACAFAAAMSASVRNDITDTLRVR